MKKWIILLIFFSLPLFAEDNKITYTAGSVNKDNMCFNSSFAAYSENVLKKIRTMANTPINSNGDTLVCFYNKGITSFLGNFSVSPFLIWGHRFFCSEAAFQWKKYFLIAIYNKNLPMLNDPLLVKFFNSTGQQAFRLHQFLKVKYSKFFHPEWNKGLRDEIMWDVLQAKFTQNPILMTYLKATGKAYLLEHNKKVRDDYWSDNSNGTGKNRLGNLLMAIRDNKPPPHYSEVIDRVKINEFCQYANSKKMGIY